MCMKTHNTARCGSSTLVELLGVNLVECCLRYVGIFVVLSMHLSKAT